jgi:3'-phosphoadenosine 5'-phosphosulfate sulfotransferase (PAPS reductase)/FAD synthetase
MNEEKLIKAFNNTPLHQRLSKTIRILKQAIERVGARHLALSFNGGKDCTVLLYIYHQLLLDINETRPIRVLYITTVDPFKEIDEFIKKSSLNYNINLETYLADMKDGLRVFLNTNPISKAIIIGTRSTDPFGEHLEEFQDTDGDWPKITRVHPILEWSYNDVWDFLRGLKIEYCSLYDQGYCFLIRYTSLGSVGNTNKNPELENESGGFDPAYLLKDGSHERSGRNK